MAEAAKAKTTAALFAMQIVAQRASEFREMARAAAAAPTEKNVHALRVSSRHFRETVAALRGTPGLLAMSKSRRLARKVARSVRRLRELDVADRLLSKLVLPIRAEREATVVQAALRAERARLSEPKVRALVKLLDRFSHEVEALCAAAATGRLARPVGPRDLARDPGHSVSKRLQRHLERRCHRARAVCLAVLDEDDRTLSARANAGELHQVRIALKRWRYADELVRLVSPEAAAGPGKRLKELQAFGGDAQDLADLRLAVLRSGERGSQTEHLRHLLRVRRRQAALRFVSALRRVVAAEWPKASRGRERTAALLEGPPGGPQRS